MKRAATQRLNSRLQRLRQPGDGVSRLLSAALKGATDAVDSASSRFDDYLRREAVDELKWFAADVRDMVRDTERRIPGLQDDHLTRVALDQIMPPRIDLACQDFVRASRMSYLNLPPFLRSLRDLLGEDLADAIDVDDAADAILRSLDHLHNYLLSHDLVGRAYRVEQMHDWSSASGHERDAANAEWWSARARRDPEAPIEA